MSPGQLSVVHTRVLSAGLMPLLQHGAKLPLMREPRCCGQEDFAGSFINLGPDTVGFNNPYTDCPDQGTVCLSSEVNDND